MMWKNYDLYQEVTIYDSRGNPKKSYEKISTIHVAISVRNVKNIEKDVIYQVKHITAITPYKKFEEKESYKLYLDNEAKYIVDSFIVSRMTQLTLKEVMR